MVDQPLLEDLCAALPVNVATAASQEAGYGVPAEMVYPSFLAQLAHQGVDPGEAGLAPFPAVEPGLGFWAVDVVVACDETVFFVDDGGEMPGYEFAMAVSVCLGEGVAELCLGAEVHVAK